MNPPAWLHRATTWLTVVGYALLASGLPLPLGITASRGDAAADARLAAKDRTRPFPCMDKPCGCATAEQCFQNCCCHTPAERLAWARAHRVEPAVVAALERRVAAVAETSRPPGGCCAAKVARKPTCCGAGGCDEPGVASCATAETDVCAESQSLDSEPTAGAVTAAAGDAPRPGSESPRAHPRLRTVTLQALLACGGILTQWLAVGGGLPPPRVELAIDMAVTAARICGDHAAEGPSQAPALPPPRAA